MTTSRNEKGDVPGLLLGDFLFCSQPGRHSEADARLVLRMAMTGESLSDLRTNLKNTYGPLMNLDILMKLMTAEQDRGKTVFYADVPSSPRDNAKKNNRKKKMGSRSNEESQKIGGQKSSRLVIKGLRNFDGFGSDGGGGGGGSIAHELIQGTSFFPVKDYFKAIHRLFGRFQQRRQRTHVKRLQSFASVTSKNSLVSENGSMSSEDSIIETVPLEIALRLLMNSKDKYGLVVNKEDIRADANTPVFCIKGIEMSLDTSEGPVTFMPMFFSKKELQKTYSVFREIVKKIWISNRVRKRSEICNRLISSVSSITGMDGVFSDTRPTVRSSTDDLDEDDGLGNGEPPEIKEFIEEMGESGADFMPSSSPSFMAIPLLLLFGCLTVSTALWKDCAVLGDLMLMNSPLGKIRSSRNILS